MNDKTNEGKKYLTKITPKQEKYINEYCSKFGEISATQCAINAGYARESAHVRARELLDWRLYPQVRAEINKRLKDTREVWKIDRDKHLRKLNDIGRKADAKGNYGVSLKAEQLRGQVAGLYVEKQMVMKAEMTVEEVNAKWKSLFNSREEAELANKEFMDDVWGKEAKAVKDINRLEKENQDKRMEKELIKYQKDRGNTKK